eukprot:305474-Prorocentrum_minimum.AAC.1
MFARALSALGSVFRGESNPPAVKRLIKGATDSPFKTRSKEWHRTASPQVRRGGKEQQAKPLYGAGRSGRKEQSTEP